MGKPQKRLYPRTITFYLIRGKPSLLRVVAAISFFPCKSEKAASELSEAVPQGYIHQSSYKRQNQRLSC